ncbi:MAG: YkgJ family cysteine cluster protein [Verrucomicrobiales bacterium]
MPILTEAAPPEGVFYQCQRCAKCCQWPGDVILTEADITAIAALLGLGEYEFIQRHTRLSRNRRFLSLLEKENGECAFLDGIECTIQSAKPEQCRGFPNKWNFPGWRDVCEAVEVRVKGAS